MKMSNHVEFVARYFTTPAVDLTQCQPPQRLLDGMRGETDSRGNVVTHVVYRGADNEPVLKLVDIAKAVSCMSDRRCQTCGLAIGPYELLGFIGASGDTT